MDWSTVKSMAIPEGNVIQIETDGIVIWKLPASYTNLVPLSTESDGTPYNGGLGYKNGYRVRSGGAEGEQSTCACTGFIPCKAGDTLRVYIPPVSGTRDLYYINVSNASKTNLGQLASNGIYGIFSGSGYTWSDIENDGDIWSFTIPTDITSANDIAFIRVTIAFSQSAETTGEGLIVTVNEEIV